MVLDDGPALDGLNGYTRLGGDIGLRSITHSSPTKAASSILAEGHQSGFFPITQPRKVATTDVHVV